MNNEKGDREMKREIDIPPRPRETSQERERESKYMKERKRRKKSKKKGSRRRKGRAAAWAVANSVLAIVVEQLTKAAEVPLVTAAAGCRSLIFRCVSCHWTKLFFKKKVILNDLSFNVKLSIGLSSDIECSIAMDSELIIVCAVQVFVLFLVLGLILAYLYKNLMLRSRVDVVGKAVLITGNLPYSSSSHHY